MVLGGSGGSWMVSWLNPGGGIRTHQMSSDSTQDVEENLLINLHMM